MKSLSLGLLLIISPVLLMSQSIDYYKSFKDKAGINSIIFRGNSPINYQFKHEGSYYLFDEQFQNGEIVFNGKSYKNIEINLNSHIDELIIKIPNSISIVIANKDFVERFVFNGKTFINYKSSQSGSPQTGYYELMYSGKDTLLKKVKKLYVEQVPQPSSSSTIRRIFNIDESYYVYVAGRWSEAKKRRDILKLYPHKRRQIVKHINESGVNFSINKDEAFVEVVKFAEQNNQIER